MTWWPVQGSQINKHLAEAAEHAWVALWLGSMRVVIEDPSTLDTFNCRKYCPSIPLFANVWVVQFNYWFEWLIDKIAKIIPQLNAPVIIKETGNWIDWVTAQKLKQAWVQRIVEWERRNDPLGDTIRWLWITTDQALQQCSQIDWLNLIAWGWIRSLMEQKHLHYEHRSLQHEDHFSSLR